ncbi:MAG TPA: TolC family protein [Chitinophagaceae bacterium]|jgi:outer membrane protein TolC|nr:TolC family protein [Chitinophagaceae bacterium]
MAQLTLEQTIEVAKKQSYTTQLLQKDLSAANLAYRIYRANLRPTLLFFGNAPGFNKDNYAVTQPDGSIKFPGRHQNYSSAGVGFSQPIPYTGGMISVNTDLYRFDDFTANTKQYNGTPVFVRLAQPLFRFNPYKWDKQIAPLKLKETSQEVKLAILQLEYEVCRLYFDIIEAQSNEQLAAVNLQHNTTNLSIEKRRLELGVSTEDRVLQLEIQQINSQQQQITGQLNTQKTFLALQTYINLPDIRIQKLDLPDKLPSLTIDKEKAIGLATQNLPVFLTFQREKLEAGSAIDQAKKQGRDIDLVASYGLNNTAPDIPAIYRSPQDQQRFNISFNIPIADWGRRKNSLAAVRLREDQLDILHKQVTAKFTTEIRNLATELPVLQPAVEQSLLLDTLSQRRFTITNRLFQSGKASLLELQAAQTEKDNARRNHIAALRKFWESYYLFRVKTGTENPWNIR